MTKAIRLSDSDLENLWSRTDTPDLELDAEDGTLRPINPGRGTVSGASSVGSRIGKAVAAAPVAAGVVLSEVARWD